MRCDKKDVDADGIAFKPMALCRFKVKLKWLKRIVCYRYVGYVPAYRKLQKLSFYELSPIILVVGITTMIW